MSGGGVEEVHILWTSEGLSCDGDSVSMTAASLPSIEEVALGLIPGLPKVHLHNKVLSPTLGGEEFMAPFRAADRTAFEVNEGPVDLDLREAGKGLEGDLFDARLSCCGERDGVTVAAETGVDPKDVDHGLGGRCSLGSRHSKTSLFEERASSIDPGWTPHRTLGWGVLQA